MSACGSRKSPPTEDLVDLVNDKTAVWQTKVALAATGVEVNDVELFRMDPHIEPESFIPALEVAAELGARNIIAQLPDPDRARAIDRFARLCDLAKPLGDLRQPGVPALDANRESHRRRRGRAGGPAQQRRLLVDTLHMDRSNSRLEELARLPREWFRFAHVCDAAKEWPHTQPEAIHTARDERLFPGEGGIDVCGILAQMPRNIPYALEIPRSVLTRAVGPEDVARLAIAVCRREIDDDSERGRSTRSRTNRQSA